MFSVALIPVTSALLPVRRPEFTIHIKYQTMNTKEVFKKDLLRQNEFFHARDILRVIFYNYCLVTSKDIIGVKVLTNIN